MLSDNVSLKKFKFKPASRSHSTGTSRGNEYIFQTRRSNEAFRWTELD
jgi:hypothetical protein